MTKLLATLALLFTLFLGSPANASPSTDYAEQVHIIRHMSVAFGVDVDVAFEPCGALNGYYVPMTNTVHLCTESSESPEAGRFIAAHEMAHAILWNRNGDSSEYHADELAALWLLAKEDDVEALQGAAWWFVTTASTKDYGDKHGSDAYRATWLVHMVDAYLGDAYWRPMLIGLARQYHLLLTLDKVG